MFPSLENRGRDYKHALSVTGFSVQQVRVLWMLQVWCPALLALHSVQSQGMAREVLERRKPCFQKLVRELLRLEQWVLRVVLVEP